MYFTGSLFSVGEHIIADVPRSGLTGARPEDKEERRRKMEDAEEKDLYNRSFALVICAITNAQTGSQDFK